jgi:hypothetical protein
MPAKSDPSGNNHQTPCRLTLAEWPTCYAHECYMNYRCAAYKGGRPCPERDYLPLPAVFILMGPFEAVPCSYRIPLKLSDCEG